MIYDLIIIGGGPGGIAAGIYAARKKIKSVLITDNFGGQSIVSNEIRNWIGEVSISGFELAQKLEAHLKSYKEEVEVLEGDLVTEIKKTFFSPPIFTIKTKNGKELNTKTVLLTLGSSRKKLNVPGEKEYEGKGVFYCATCDAPLMTGKKTLVVGGGNSALESALDLIPYASKIYILVRSSSFKADPLTVEKVIKNEKVEVIWESEIMEFFGSGNILRGVKYLEKRSEQIKTLEVDGVFVEIGSVPNTYLVKDLVKLNEKGEIIIDHKTQKTSEEGIWAAGDITDGLYKQNNISVGDAIKAVLNIYDYLKQEKS
jgi:alkyl hydroperoxide reductase subunit AhpF